ncbi:MAG: selenophosphate synthase [Clostridia bacterium]|nr:selenophosphate synthase [Clostridia bacterium]
MAQVLCHLPKFEDENLIVGLETSDDAAVYKIDDNRGIILTLDFFTPVVDDPYLFGQIAAANSLSDVYAMGGKPITAMNITCFPSCLPINVLTEILKGGADKVKEAGAIVVGGHTVEDDEPKFGLSVMGMVALDQVTPNAAASPGDLLILTKPLGLGIINTAVKADVASAAAAQKAIDTMAYLNKDAAEAAARVGVNACTDITGFGLLGHAYEMAEGSGVTIELWSDLLPIINESIELAKMGIIPAGAYNNRKHLDGKLLFCNQIPQHIEDVMFDPQTSGGLLFAVKGTKAEELMKLLRENNRTECAIIGKVKERKNYFIEII